MHAWQQIPITVPSFSTYPLRLQVFVAKQFFASRWVGRGRLDDLLWLDQDCFNGLG